MCYEKRDPKIARECFIRDQGGNMDQYTATELAYNNGYERGYEQGKKDAVKHGRWDEKFFTNDRQRVCSVCHCTVRQPSYDRGETALFRYCPHCGSRMDGGNEDG